MKLCDYYIYFFINILCINAFTCSVVKDDEVLFSYDIQEFMVNDGICDCCDCSDEFSLTNKVNFCNELIDEYQDILVNGLIRNNIDLGKKQLLNKLILNENELVKSYNDLLREMDDEDEIQDIKTYKQITSEIIAFFEESLQKNKNHAEVSKRNQRDNISNLKKFFQKEIPLIMLDDKEGMKKIHSDIKTLKGLKEKYTIVKFMLVTLEKTSGVSFKYSQDLLQLDDIIERYGDEYFKENQFFNAVNIVKDSIYGVDNRVATYKLQNMKQNKQNLKGLTTRLDILYAEYDGMDLTSYIIDYFTLGNDKFNEPLKSTSGKYLYLLYPDGKLIQQSIGSNEEYLVGEIKNIEFKNSTIASHQDDIYQMMWKYVQGNHTSKHLHKSIPDKNSTISKELLNKNNIMKINIENGDECWNGPKRSAVMRFQCSSKEFEVVEVVEVDKCTYEIDVNSIFGCS